MKIVVIGGSAAGMFASLVLARAGHEILVLERDVVEIAPDVESAAAQAFRAGAPHIVQPHIIMARCRQLLLEHLPDVYTSLISAGVLEATLKSQFPASLCDRSDRPGDEQFTLLMTRRSTIDWVLRKTVMGEPRITCQYGTRVTGLLAVDGQPPRVVGVRTTQGDVYADLVLDASGYRTPIDQWLLEIGAHATTVERAECGVAYFSRYFRIRAGASLPGPRTTRTVLALNEFNAGIWAADNGTMQIAVAPLAMDHRFRTVKSPAVFSAVLATVPTLAAWLPVLEPISDVFTMGGVHNSLRRLVSAAAPVALGLHAIGDSVCTTNPTFGRGLTLALLTAIRLREILDELEDPTAQALALDQFVMDELGPFYVDQAAVDGTRMAMLRHSIFGDPLSDPPDMPAGQVSFTQVRTAAPYDPTAFRALWRLYGMLDKPTRVYADPEVVARTREALVHCADAPPIPQPSREQLLAALATQA